jgi:hypothetical protein
LLEREPEIALTEQREYNFQGGEQSEPGILKLMRWAFSNPEKVAAVGLGIAAFGLATFLLNKADTKKNIVKKEENNDGEERLALSSDPTTSSS